VTRLEFAEALVAVDRDTDARELLTQAQTTFAELRATPWLERADAATRGHVASTARTIPA
jgi:hypothetical protein